MKEELKIFYEDFLKPTGRVLAAPFILPTNFRWIYNDELDSNVIEEGLRYMGAISSLVYNFSVITLDVDVILNRNPDLAHLVAMSIINIPLATNITSGIYETFRYVKIKAEEKRLIEKNVKKHEEEKLRIKKNSVTKNLEETVKSPEMVVKDNEPKLSPQEPIINPWDYDPRQIEERMIYDGGNRE